MSDKTCGTCAKASKDTGYIYCLEDGCDHMVTDDCPIDEYEPRKDSWEQLARSLIHSLEWYRLNAATYKNDVEGDCPSWISILASGYDLYKARKRVKALEGRNE